MNPQHAKDQSLQCEKYYHVEIFFRSIKQSNCDVIDCIFFQRNGFLIGTGAELAFVYQCFDQFDSNEKAVQVNCFLYGNTGTKLQYKQLRSVGFPTFLLQHVYRSTANCSKMYEMAMPSSIV